ncbi:MAG: peptidoglycan-binding protein, partial [Rhodospirillaceae bacterium]|nr:peptidoglycan-binding protein [Rhodospirillales bacterium]
VGGPAGAAVGLGVGAAAGVGVEKGQQRGMIPPEPGEQSTAQAGSNDVRQAQTALRDQGLYHGPIDGIEGPLTKQAANEFQRRQGLPQTATLDRPTMDAINGSLAALPPERGPRAPR